MGFKFKSFIKHFARATVSGGSSIVKDTADAQKNKIAKDKEKARSAGAQEATDVAAGTLAAEKEKTLGFEESAREQDAMRKKMASLGRVSRGTAFNDTKFGTAKTFS